MGQVSLLSNCQHAVLLTLWRLLHLLPPPVISSLSVTPSTPLPASSICIFRRYIALEITEFSTSSSFSLNRSLLISIGLFMAELLCGCFSTPKNKSSKSKTGSKDPHSRSSWNPPSNQPQHPEPQKVESNLIKASHLGRITCCMFCCRLLPREDPRSNL